MELRLRAVRHEMFIDTNRKMIQAPEERNVSSEYYAPPELGLFTASDTISIPFLTERPGRKAGCN